MVERNIFLNFSLDPVITNETRTIFRSHNRNFSRCDHTLFRFSSQVETREKGVWIAIDRVLLVVVGFGELIDDREPIRTSAAKGLTAVQVQSVHASLGCTR